jgi:predicted nuclease of restriction endonuclease-like (RecB) superfamily
MAGLKASKNYSHLIKNIGKTLEEGRKQALIAVNNILIETYWNIGRQIVEFEQKGKNKAEYGSALLKKLSIDLKKNYGTGFSKSNIYLMRTFYLKYPKFQTVSGKLSWSHYSELLMIDNNIERSFYEKQCVEENWSVRKLKRQVGSVLFHRILLSKNKKEAQKLSKNGQNLETARDLVRDPYVLEFLGIPENYTYSEKELEQKIIENLQMFLLELGKGFTFVARQFRITLGNKHYYLDLVFYNRILKCFVIIDLKIGKVCHGDIGQMNMYLNYFKEEENSEGDSEPIGIILAARKDNIEIEYALGGLSNRLFVSKYKLYLPNKKELGKQLRKLT